MATKYECDKCKQQYNSTIELKTFELPTLEESRRAILSSKKLDLCINCTAKLAVVVREFTN